MTFRELRLKVSASARYVVRDPSTYGMPRYRNTGSPYPVPFPVERAARIIRWSEARP